MTSPLFSRAARHTAISLLMAALGLGGCRKSAAATAGDATADDAGPRVVGDHLVLSRGDPRIATLETVLPTAAGEDSLRVPGRVVWDEDVTVRVFSPFAGRVIRVTANVGERVRAEDTLALIASPDFGQAQADARRAATDLALAKRTADRTRDLLQHGVAAQKDFDAAEADLARARVEQQRTRTRLTIYGADTSAIDQAFPLRSPLSGLVVERSVTPGQEVRPDQMLANAPQLFAPLFVVTNPSRLWVVLDVPERDLPLVKTGAAITVRPTSWASRVLSGRITFVSGAVDPSTRTLKVRGTVLNPGDVLKAEMLVSVSLSSVHSGGVVVPSSAVLLHGGDHIAFVDEGSGKLRRVPVTIGWAHRGVVQVLSGLRTGDRVVTNGSLLFEQLFQHSKPHA